MISLLFLIQFAFAEDFIKESLYHTFERIESNECIYTGTGESSKYYFNNANEVKATFYKTDDCSGTGVTETETPTNHGYKYMQTPKYVGFTVNDGTSNCKYEKYAQRTYYKEGCGKLTLNGMSVEFKKESDSLVLKNYKSGDCSGSPDKTVTIGQCDKCVTGEFNLLNFIKLKGSFYVQCGTVSQMILLILALILFFF